MRRLSIHFLGGGNMADALISGLVTAGHDPACISVTEPDEARAESLRQHYDVRAQLPGEAVAGDAVIVLAVKPQQAAAALAATPLPAACLLLSIAAGLRCDWLRGQLPDSARVVRCMPNTPARVGAGITGLWAGGDVDDEARAQADYILGAAGATVWLEDEEQINAVTALSGSGPAYVFALGEAMAKAGEALGLPRETADALARQTLMGAGRLLAEDSASPGELRARVTSKGGTTAAALDVLQQGDLDGLLARAMVAAEARARALSAPPSSDS